MMMNNTAVRTFEIEKCITVELKSSVSDASYSFEILYFYFFAGLWRRALCQMQTAAVCGTWLCRQQTGQDIISDIFVRFCIVYFKYPWEFALINYHFWIYDLRMHRNVFVIVVIIIHSVAEFENLCLFVSVAYQWDWTSTEYNLP